MGKTTTLLNMTLCLLATMLAGCTDEVTGTGGTPYRDGGSTIAFHAGCPGTEAETRGMQLTAANTVSFGVSASYYTSGTYATAPCGSYFLNQQVLTAIGNSGQMWPGAEYTLSFFAYAPYSNLVGIVSGDDPGRPVYTYTVPTDITSQIDFMTAESLEVNGEETEVPVALAFSHRLADIRFSVYNEGENDMTVHSIALHGLKYSGTYDDENGWILDAAVNSASQHPFKLDLCSKSDPDDGVTVEPLQESGEVTGTADHFMMLPQTVASGTRWLEIDATINGTRQLWHHALPSGQTLAMGQSYGIRLRMGYNHIEVEVTSIEDWTFGSDTSSATPRGRQEGTVDGESDVDNWAEQYDESSGKGPRSREDGKWERSDQQATGIEDWTEQE